MPARVLIGVVTSDKAAKTRRVEINRLVQHPKYKKYVRRRTVCHVHDEDNESALGDTVEIQECRPLSRTKRWKLVRVVEKSREVDISELRAARKAQAETEERKVIEELAGQEGQSEAGAPGVAE
ncbi:MAG: 30S ribosomal protein S17 [Pirellulaceae bacterium]|nr:MAG: 30S ribosomal protein S17 [Pirellulaceae bacterium]